MKRKNGLTLIELLVTISILAILSTIAMVVYSGIIAKARDSQRMRDLQTIKQALELYRSDQGYYPRFQAGGPSLCTTPSYNGWLLFTAGTANCPLKDLTGQKIYINSPPKDPLGAQYSYQPQPSACDNAATKCTNYCLYATVENSSNATTPPLLQCSTAPASTYQTQAP